jgi:hypothetical protein
MTRRRNNVDVAKELRFRAKAACFHAGATRVPRKIIEDKVVSTIVEGGKSDERAQRQAENARRKSIRIENGELGQEITENRKKVGPAEKAHAEAIATRQAAEHEDIPPYGGTRNGAPLALFAITDGAFNFWALCDVAGVDLTTGFGNLSPLVAVMLALVALLGVVGNTLAGFVATSPVSPRRRLIGWALLLAFAITLAVMRAESTPETNVAFTVFGCILSMVAGLAGGIIQRRILPIIAAHRAHARKVALAEKAEAEAKAKLDAVLFATDQLNGRRRSLRAEVENLACMPARRAARNAEIDKIQAARIKAVHYYYALGQRFSGRKTGDEKREVADA